MPTIPNTTITPIYNNSNVLTAYRITPNEGYVLHDRVADWYDYDDDGNFIGISKMRYSVGSCSCDKDYDFSTRTVTDENGNTFTAYGEREFFARLADDVPENSTYGDVVDNEHEVM